MMKFQHLMGCGYQIQGDGTIISGVKKNDPVQQLFNRKNAGPKDYLANERTFLAWIRTSIALLGLGAVVVKFAYPVIGVIMVVLGAVMAVLAYVRYLKIENQLNTNSFSPSRGLTAIVTVAIVLGCIFMVIYLLPGCGVHIAGLR